MMISFANLLPIGMLLTGFLGSIHCVGMCGPLLLTSTTNVLEKFIYNVGRLIGYVCIALMLSYLGVSLESIKPLQYVMTCLIGFGFILMGIIQIFSIKKLQKSVLLQRWHQWSMAIMLKASGSSQNKKKLRPFIIGASSSLLPCGFLYSVLLSTILTESWVQGGVILVFFWIGTLPAMILLPTWLQGMSFVKRIPRPLTQGLFILAGLSILYLKLSGAAHSHCH